MSKLGENDLLDTVLPAGTPRVKVASTYGPKGMKRRSATAVPQQILVSTGSITAMEVSIQFASILRGSMRLLSHFYVMQRVECDPEHVSPGRCVHIPPSFRRLKDAYPV